MPLIGGVALGHAVVRVVAGTAAKTFVRGVVTSAPRTAARFIVAIGVVTIVEKTTGKVLEPGDLVALTGGAKGIGGRIGFKVAQKDISLPRFGLPKTKFES